MNVNVNLVIEAKIARKVRKETFYSIRNYECCFKLCQSFDSELLYVHVLWI